MLIYGKEAIFPPNILLPSSQLARAFRGTGNQFLQIQIHNLLKLEESRSKSRKRFKHQQDMVKRWFDKQQAGKREFEVGNLVLKWDHLHDEKGKHTKFQQF